MKKYKADVVVIGAGAGGLAAAIEVKKAKLPQYCLCQHFLTKFGLF